MKRKLDLIENFKTIILVVLFLITILLLYLTYNQDGSDFSLSEIISVRQSSNVNVNIDEYLAPSYTIKTGENGHYLITYKNQQKAFSVASECAGNLLSASNVDISEISEDAYTEVCQSINSVQLIFDYDFPFDDFCKRILGKTLSRPEELKAFRSMLFSDEIKSDLYMRNLEGKCFKISVAENYYSTDALANVLIFDGGEIRFKDIYQLSFRSIGEKPEIDWNGIPERVFGDTLDFVRKITDKQGNVTYMYGYGQKRLSVNTDNSLEYKCEVSGTNEPDFYDDLEIALRYTEEKLGIDEQLLDLKSTELVSLDETELYHFVFEAEGYRIVTEVKAGNVSYYSISTD